MVEAVIVEPVEVELISGRSHLSSPHFVVAELPAGWWMLWSTCWRSCATSRLKRAKHFCFAHISRWLAPLRCCVEPVEVGVVVDVGLVLGAFLVDGKFCAGPIIIRSAAKRASTSQ